MRRRLLVASCLLSFVAGVGLAQTTTAPTNRVLSILHVSGQTKTAADVIQNVKYWYVNRQDCGIDSYPNAEAVPRALIRVSDTTTSNVHLNQLAPQIWIGSNCNIGTNRTSATNVICTRAIGTTAGGMISLSNNVYTLSLDAIRPADTTRTALDICNASSSGKIEFFIFSQNESTGSDVTNYIYFSLNGDMAPPTTVSVTTTSPSGDNSAQIDYTSNGTIEAGATVEYFAIADGCAGGPSLDAGTASDAGTDGGSGDGGTGTTAPVRTASTYPVEGQVPPVGAPGVVTGPLGLDGNSSVSTSALGLSVNGDGATFGVAVADAARNYSVLSNVVCVRKIDTYTICDSVGGCPKGSCTVDVPGRVSIVAVCAMVAAAIALVRRRGSRT